MEDLLIILRYCDEVGMDFFKSLSQEDLENILKYKKIIWKWMLNDKI